MKNTFLHFVGLLLCCSAIFGLLLTWCGILLIWILNPPIQKITTDNLKIIRDTLESNSYGLQLADDSLTMAIGSVETLENIVVTLLKTLEDTQPLIDTFSSLIAKDIPITIQSTQISLESAQKSAKLIDDILRILTAIPFFPDESYNPSVPLNVALGKVTKSLDALPETLISMEDSFKKTSNNLEVVKTNTELIVADIGEIKNSMMESRMVIAQYQEENQKLHNQVTGLEAKIPSVVRTTSWVITIVLFWLSTTQIGLFIQGIEIFQRRTEHPK